jgi:hypothetical protein
VEQAVGVVEELLFGERLARVGGGKVGQAGIGDGVAPTPNACQPFGIFNRTCSAKSRKSTPSSEYI